MKGSPFSLLVFPIPDVLDLYQRDVFVVYFDIMELCQVIRAKISLVVVSCLVFSSVVRCYGW